MTPGTNGLTHLSMYLFSIYPNAFYYLAKRFSLIISIKYIHIWGPISLNNRLFKRLAKIWTLHFPFTNLRNPQLVSFGLQLRVDFTFPGFAA